MHTDPDSIKILIEPLFDIQSFTLGGERQGYLIQFHGTPLEKNPLIFHTNITQILQPYHLTVLFEKDVDTYKLTVFPNSTSQKKSKPILNLALFFITLVSVLFTGGLMSAQEPSQFGVFSLISHVIVNGWPFALSLLAILGAHEFGHYFIGRARGIDVTLPFFIPMPLSMLGTMGAFINIRSLPKNKRDLFDMAVAGPLSGLIVSIIILFIGLRLSSLSVLPDLAASQSAIQMEGNSLLYLLIKRLTFGFWLPSPAGTEGQFVPTFWASYFFTASPFPAGGIDVLLHPVAWAGWAGLLVTSLNLIPAGQLDGGHIFFSVFGRKKMQRIFPIVISALVLLGFSWFSWWLWAFILFFMGRVYAEPLDRVTELDSTRRWIGYGMFLVFILTFMPVPISIFGL